MQQVTNFETEISILFREVMDSLTPAEKKVAEYIYENRDKVIHLSITDLAQKSNSSESTIVRFCKKIRLKGYQELRVALAKEVIPSVKIIHQEVNLEDDVKSIKSKVFHAAAQALSDTEQILKNESLEEAVHYIKYASSISFFGIGASGVIATDAFYRFSKLGIPCFVGIDGHSQLNKAILLKENDIVVAISHSGNTLDVLRALKQAKKQGAKVIAITQFGHSPITEIADVVLFTSSNETAFRSEAMASRIVQAAILDSIFVGVAVTRYEEVIQNYERAREVKKVMRIDRIKDLE